MNEELSRIADLESKLNSLLQYQEYITNHINEKLDLLSPIGSVLIHMSASYQPDGFIECDGRPLEKVKYTRLYAVIQDQFTPENERDSGFFRIPDMKFRTPIGQSNLLSLGSTAGTQNVTLLEENLPSHAHQGYCENAYYDNEAAVSHGPALGTALFSHLSPIQLAFRKSVYSHVTIEKKDKPVDPISVMQPSIGVRFLIRVQ